MMIEDGDRVPTNCTSRKIIYHTKYLDKSIIRSAVSTIYRGYPNEKLIYPLSRNSAFDGKFTKKVKFDVKERKCNLR